MRKSVIIRFIISICLAAGYWLAYTRWLNHVLFYQEQHHLLIYNSNYISQRMSAEGLMGVVNDFLIQFYHIPWLGALILAVLCASVYLLGDRLIRLLTRRPDYAGLAIAGSVLVFLSTAGIDNRPTAVWLVPLCIGAALLTCRVLMPESRRECRGRCEGYLWVSVLLALIYGGVGYWWLLNNINRSERTMIMTEKAVKEGRWAEVIDRADNYMASGRQNKLLSMFRSLAYAKRGELAEHLLDFPQQFGVEGLFLPWHSDVRESEYGYHVYEATGYINEAHRWESEALVAWGMTAPHLLNLAKYNIAMDRPEVARHFLTPLKSTLFYRAEASELEKQLETGKVEGLNNSLKNDSAQVNMFANVLNLIPELSAISSSDPSNIIAKDYLLAMLLLSNNVKGFVEALPKDMKPMPVIYQQALLIYKLRVGEEQFAAEGLHIDPVVEKYFEGYAKASQSMDVSALAARYGNTYWFYINHVSPHGRKAIDH